uniref:Coenzyme Q-binding protein COQ10 START domain-containing protein n=1 Tax=Pyramimonas obovata TaxID=1411642 RepID=A0A7S0N064_9CHLO|eukprot:CAMPEP_0118928952 /NCGR_PEP_ID=MMETSP1169-20130426/6087_1 /TAXON_ID=36882 /ORGANISM="Pyramimonas obovata, Strain CCMP722" /LENGTH=256 /DNA_ID=CAMNT_0006871049 /DNA_START=58 /DNA_END=828 /DNA_ORIENTATION=-
MAAFSLSKVLPTSTHSLQVRSARPSQRVLGGASRRSKLAIRAQSQATGTEAGESKIQTSGESVVKIVAEVRATAPVKKSTSPGLDLATYLSESNEFVDDLSLPLGAVLKRTEKAKWVILLPKLDLFDVWVQPTATAGGETKMGEFHIWSKQADIKGSHHVESLELYKRYDCDADIRWMALDPDTIMCAGKLVLNIDMPAPFSAMPKAVTQGAGDFAVGTMMSVLSDNFTKSLADDYNNWATNVALREKRKANYWKE